MERNGLNRDFGERRPSRSNIFLHVAGWIDKTSTEMPVAYSVYKRPRRLSDLPPPVSDSVSYKLIRLTLPEGEVSRRQIYPAEVLDEQQVDTVRLGFKPDHRIFTLMRGQDAEIFLKKDSSGEYGLLFREIHLRLFPNAEIGARPYLRVVSSGPE